MGFNVEIYGNEMIITYNENGSCCRFEKIDDFNTITIQNIIDTIKEYIQED